MKLQDIIMEMIQPRQIKQAQMVGMYEKAWENWTEKMGNMKAWAVKQWTCL